MAVSAALVATWAVSTAAIASLSGVTAHAPRDAPLDAPLDAPRVAPKKRLRCIPMPRLERDSRLGAATGVESELSIAERKRVGAPEPPAPSVAAVAAAPAPQVA